MTSPSHRLDWRPLFGLVVLLLFGGLAFYFARIIPLQDPTAGSDFGIYWAAARLVRLGGDPYNAVDWKAMCAQMPAVPPGDETLLNFLPIALLFVPLSGWPETAARDLWLVISQFMILGTVVSSVATSQWRHSRALFLPFILASLLCFFPAIVAVLNGQIGTLLGLVIALTIFCWSREKWGVGGAILGLLIVKPAGAGIFLVITCLWLGLHRKWRGLAGIAATLAITLGLTFLLQPNWFMEWAKVGLGRVSIAAAEMPTLWGMVAQVTASRPGWQVIAGGVTGGVLLLTVGTLTRWPAKRQLMGLAGILLPASLLSAPYLIDYEMVLLIPSIIAGMAMLDENGAPFNVVALWPFGLSLLGVGLYTAAWKYGNLLEICLPICVMGSFLWAQRYRARPNPASNG